MILFTLRRFLPAKILNRCFWHLLQFSLKCVAVITVFVQSVIKMCLITHEILDKFVDIATAVEYHKGKLFHKPKDSVYRALLAFTIIGCFISFFRICLYFWGIYLDCCSKESHDKRYDDFDMAMQSIKVILEAFPQSVIAKFYFVHCPRTKYG